MSFYGNVYYQFIDTFYKAIAKNTIKGHSLPTEVQTDVELPINAIGRQGIFHLTNGNDWIKFKKEDDITFSIWHDKPDESHQGTSFLYGINIPEIGEGKKYADNKAFDDAWKPVQLNPGDAFTTCGYYCDEAGHIMYNAKGNAAKYQLAYRLPRYDELDELTDLEALVGMNEDGKPIDKNGAVILDAFKEATISETVINNETEISNHDTRVKKIEDIYNGSNNFFNNIYETGTFELKNFPKYFGNIDQMISSWSNYLGDINNSNILGSLLNDDKYKNYISKVSGGGITFATVSAIISLLPGVIDIVKKSLEASIKAIDDKTDVATELVKVIAQTVDSDIFNADNTIPETFGKNDDSKCYFDQDNSVASAFGLTDNEKACFFNEENSVKKNIQNLAADIADLNNDKTDKSTFNEEIQKINEALNAKVDNSDLENYYSRDDIDSKIGSIEDDASTGSSIYAYIKSLENEINTLKTRVEELEKPTPPDEGGEDNGNDENGAEPSIPEDGE